MTGGGLAGGPVGLAPMTLDWAMGMQRCGSALGLVSEHASLFCVCYGGALPMASGDVYWTEGSMAGLS